MRLIVMLAILSTIFGCGNNDSNGKYTYDDDGAPNACNTTGTLENFEVKCTKDIKSFQIGKDSSPTMLNISSNGRTIKIEKIDDKTLKGELKCTASDCLNYVQFIIIHTDGFKSTINVKR